MERLSAWGRMEDWFWNWGPVPVSVGGTCSPQSMCLCTCVEHGDRKRPRDAYVHFQSVPQSSCYVWELGEREGAKDGQGERVFFLIVKKSDGRMSQGVARL